MFVSFVETITLNDQIPVYEEQLCLSNINLYFEINQAQINTRMMPQTMLGHAPKTFRIFYKWIQGI